MGAQHHLAGLGADEPEQSRGGGSLARRSLVKRARSSLHSHCWLCQPASGWVSHGAFVVRVLPTRCVREQVIVGIARPLLEGSPPLPWPREALRNSSDRHVGGTPMSHLISVAGFFVDGEATVARKRPAHEVPPSCDTAWRPPDAGVGDVSGRPRERR